MVERVLLGPRRPENLPGAAAWIWRDLGCAAIALQ
jgi:hypothetical protein